MFTKKNFLCLALVFLAFGGCEKDSILQKGNSLKSFSFTKAKNGGLDKDYDVSIDEAGKTARVTLPTGTDVTALVATFTSSAKSKVKVGVAMQKSGTTANDFSSPVVYSVIAEDGSKADYTVTVTVAPYVAPVFVETADETAQRNKIKKIYDELMAYYDGKSDNVINGDANQYSTVPSITKDGAGKITAVTFGVYKPDFKAYMLKWWAFFKAIGRRPDPFYHAPHEERAQKAAFVGSAVRRLNHGISADDRAKISPPMKKDDVDLAHAGSRQSNLFTVGAKYWFHETVQFNFTEGKVRDDLGANVPAPDKLRMGHRWAGLWKKAASAGIGYNFFNNYTVATFFVVYNLDRDDGFNDFSAFPHGYFPLQAQMQLKNTRSASSLFNKKYPDGFRHDWNFKKGFHTTWTIQQIATYNFTPGKAVTVTIRDVDETGMILDKITGKVEAVVKKDNGSFLWIKNKKNIAGWTFTIKPKDGILTDAVKTVLNNNKKKVFHITIEGEGMTPKTAAISQKLTYRIIYYDVDH